MFGVEGEKQRRKDGREGAGDRSGPQEDEHNERHAGDQGGQAGDDQVLSEKPEPLGDKDREQRRAVVDAVGDLQLPSASQDWAAKK